MGNNNSTSSLPAAAPVSSQNEPDEPEFKFVNASTVDEMKAMIRDGLVDNSKGPYGNIRNKDVDGNNYTALMYQCASRNIYTMKFLLEECNPPADPNLTNNNGKTALHFSVYVGDK